MERSPFVLVEIYFSWTFEHFDNFWQVKFWISFANLYYLAIIIKSFLQVIAPPSTSPLASAVTLATVLPSISAGSGTPASTGVQATGAAVPPVQTPSQHLSQAASSVPSEGRSMAGSAGGVPAGPAGPAPGFSQATSAQLQPQSQTPRQEQQQQQNFAAAVQQLNGKNSCTILFLLKVS